MRWFVAGLLFLALDPHFSAIVHAQNIGAQYATQTEAQVHLAARGNGEEPEPFSASDRRKAKDVASSLGLIVLIFLLFYTTLIVWRQVPQKVFDSVRKRHNSLAKITFSLLKDAIPYITMIGLKSITERLGSMTSNEAFIVWVIGGTAFLRICYDYYTNPNSMMRVNPRQTVVKTALLVTIDVCLISTLYNLMERAHHDANGDSTRWGIRVILSCVTILIRTIAYGFILENFWLKVDDSQRSQSVTTMYLVMIVVAAFSIGIYLSAGRFLATPRFQRNDAVSLSVLRAMDSSINLVDGVATIVFVILTYGLANEICMAVETPYEYRITIRPRIGVLPQRTVAPLLDSLDVIIEARKVHLRKAQRDTRQRIGAFYIEYPERLTRKLCPSWSIDTPAPCQIEYNHFPVSEADVSRTREMKDLKTYFLEIIRVHHAASREDFTNHSDHADDAEWIPEDTRWVADEQTFRDLLQNKVMVSAKALMMRTKLSFGDQNYLLPRFMRPKATSCRDRAIGYSVMACLMVIVKISAAFSWW